ncbi:hypothetical protein Vretifemale_12782 [Volvox reticuliferus]|uniref:Activating signal cointegrator 1 third domain-containing protein n=1 Tax=Volvox reticuliferus TaxID=1737510 RepID=A0A8J4CLB4_9CHLO|nr:hypothetical protein Vretifemale_12782 [Volvox reticuliferus]
MARHRDAKWLKEQLSRVLGWDELILEGLVDAVAQAAGPGGDRSELEAMVQNFMADSPAGIAIINDFIALQQQPAPSRPRAGGGGGASAAVSAAAAAAATATAAASTNTSTGKSYAASASVPSTSASAAAWGRGHQQQQQGRGQRQQQQQQQQRQHQPVGSKPAGAPAAPHSWQTLGAHQNKGGGAAAATAASAGGGSPDGDGGDDFSRFVVDDRTADGGLGSRGAGGSRSKPGSSRDLQALEAGVAGGTDKQTSPGAAAAAAGGGSGKVLGMFKAGGRIKAPAAKPVGVRAPDGGALALAASLERKVLNCLGCGKIYDCRSVTNDILRFLDRGGVCTFCGDTVPLSYKDRQKAAAAAAAKDAESSPEPVGAPGAAGEEDAATAAARAFKDRLVEYDRNAAKRTTVIDDQSDFFEIDTNSWLTDQERAELRQRRQMEKEAEEARRRRLTVTIDLIGRKVVLDEDVKKAEEAAAAAAAERAAAAAKAAAAAEALRNTDGDRSGSGGAYGSGVAFGSNVMASVAGGGPTREQLAASLESLRRMKATINPSVAATSAAPLFLPTAVHTTAAGAAVGAKSGSGGGGGAAIGGGGGGGGARRYGPAEAAGAGGGGRPGAGGVKGANGGGPAGRHVGTTCSGRLHERVQHDLGAEFGFDAFGAEVALDELLGGALLAAEAEAVGSEKDGAYDICSVGVAPSTSTGPRAPLPHQQYRAPGGVPRSVDGLPPGVVLLKGYLTMDEQIRIVHEIRELGIGPGGFYIPSYITGGRLWLHMMCMGLHWEPRTNSYETIRYVRAHGRKT